MSEIKGTIKEIREEKLNPAGTWKSVEFVLELPNEWNHERPKYAVLKIGNKPDADTDKVADFLKFKKVGDLVDVKYNLDGFTWTDKDTGVQKYANSLSAWSVYSAKEEDSTDEEVAEDGNIEDPFDDDSNPPF